MNEKFNKNVKVEQLTNMFLSRGEESGLIVKDPSTHFERIFSKCIKLIQNLKHFEKFSKCVTLVPNLRHN